MPQTLFIGLMSGTSTDGVDAVLADFSTPDRPCILASSSLAMPDALRREFLALNITGPDELLRSSLAGNALAELYAGATRTLLTQANLGPDKICAIGAHGQTVRHDPAAGFTIQINAPALLAERTGIAVVADFRSRDVAAGGQGAPLVPAFHHALFSHSEARAVLNLGGIANVTLLSPDGDIRGFDTGPANVLMDLWVQHKTGVAYDAQGSWASTGQANQTLLDFLLRSEPWFELAPPKSTGRDLFNWKWLMQRLDAFEGPPLADNDIQATLQQLTAATIAHGIKRYAPDTRDVLVCGGGALNDGLIRDLQRVLPCPLRTTADFGVPVQLVEALAFAWLAWAHVNGYRAGLPKVTGARHASILGCTYPA
ncbi:anhydro-N-acetylmuramic acid kinase [Candidimonas sp. SYP-B2681]|uniref:anhydro-N-acetylmuramic acid kinase n=1 Tax=Candidimonas sp. SYP-B2681 TaxID=2497686 RepID=UPI000F85BED0|nr:anhydro-N-acetylmuramic acid kinase [Candidimonas sp. SYP-B2681]RTZ39941.1 anhydro-N-acetylmuramic acid kinase [Candidimonas sp. SYP-B2681]